MLNKQSFYSNLIFSFLIYYVKKINVDLLTHWLNNLSLDDNNDYKDY